MRERKTGGETVSILEAGQRFALLLDRVLEHETRMIVERDGVAVAAIVPIADLRAIDRIESDRDAEFAVRERIGTAFKDVPDEEIEQNVAPAAAAARAEHRGQDVWRREARSVVAAMREPFKDMPPQAIEREVTRAIAEGRQEQPREKVKGAAGG